MTGPSSGADASARILGFFGITCQKINVGNLLALDAANGAPLRLLSSSAAFLDLVQALEQDPGALARWQSQMHSAFVFGDGNDRSIQELAQCLMGGNSLKYFSREEAALVCDNSVSEWVVSTRFPEFCGPMSGIKTVSHEMGPQLIMEESRLANAGIITGKRGAAFAKLNYKGVPVFISTSGLIDIDAKLETRNFDIRRHFLSATPMVMYVRWAFAEGGFEPEETSACLIIDDPPLKPRYGFLNFQRLDELMSRYGFTSSVAFIPWNWRRSHRRVVELFKKNPDKFSLSVHGCDHTRAEFGTQNGGRLRWKVNCASARMKRHESQTGLHHDQVMVFPQGVFSPTAMRALKGSDFIGVVNSEVISDGLPANAIKISDFWNVAVMTYDSFPIYTRRYPWQGIENFAFDILLGKPCIVVVHHNDCHDDCRHVVQFIEQLNRLNARLVWRNLGEVVRRSFRRRKLSSNVLEIEMFGKELCLENRGDEKKYFCIRKLESAPGQIKEVCVGNQSVDWATIPGGVAFQTELEPGQSQIIRIVFREFSENSFDGENLSYHFKVMLRRYLCEFRDNYVMGKSFSH